MKDTASGGSAPSATERTPLLANGHGNNHAEVQDAKEKLAKAKTRRWIIIPAVFFGQFLFSVDTSMVVTLGPSIGSTFDAAQLAPSLGSYYLAGSAAAMPVWGQVSNIVGRRPIIVGASVLFTLCTLGCASAPSMGVLLAFRLLAGVGGSGVVSMGHTVTGDLVSQRERGLLHGFLLTLWSVGMAAGPLLGGVLNDWAGWRAAFYLQVPLMVLVTLSFVIFVNIPLKFQDTTLTRWQRFKQIDWLGAVLILVSIGCIVAGLQMGGNVAGWTEWPVILVLALGLLGLAAFLYVEGRVAKKPILALNILFTRTVGAVSATHILHGIVVYSSLYQMPYIFLILLDLTPSSAGTLYLPTSFAMAIGGLVVGYLIRRRGYYQPIITICSSIIVFTPLTISWAWLPNYDKWYKYDWRYYAGSLPVSLGRTGCMAGLLLACIAAVDHEGMAAVTSLAGTTQVFGQVLGVSLSTAIVQGNVKNRLLEAFADRADGAELAERIRTNIEVIRQLPPDLKAIALDAYKVSLQIFFKFSAVIAVLSTITCALIPSHKLAEQAPVQDEPRAEEEQNRDNER